jgi:putative peptidoglycan lipid II flippase
MLAVLLNLVLNLSLLSVLGGAGLAWATAVSAAVQVVLTGWLLDRRLGPLPWGSVGRFAIKTLIATAVMSGACLFAAAWFPPGESQTARALAVLVPLAVGLTAYFLAAVALRMDDLWRLVRRDASPAADD